MKLNDRKEIIKSTMTRPQILKTRPGIHEEKVIKCTNPTVRKDTNLA